MSKPPPPSSTRARSPRPFFTPPRTKSSAARKICICNWGEGCCQLMKFFGEQTGHPYSGKPFDSTVSDTCDFVNFWKGCVKYFHLSPQQQEAISTSPGGRGDERVRFRIARHHFPMAILEQKISSSKMKLFKPLSREDISELGCYANISPPPTQDSVFHYDTLLGRGVAASAAKRLHAELHFRVVPCMSRDEVTSMAAALQNAGTAEARLDMAATRDRSRSIEQWQSLVSSRDETIAALRKRVAELESDVAQKDSEIKKMRDTEKAWENCVRRRNHSIDSIERSFKKKERDLFSKAFMGMLSEVGGISRLTMLNRKWHANHNGRKGSLNAAKLLWGYESFEEAKQYAKAYFHEEVDVEYDPSRHVKLVDGEYVLPQMTLFEQCMIARMFFHWYSSQPTIGLFLDRHRTRVGQILKVWAPKWANVGMDLAILDVTADYLHKECRIVALDR